MIKYLNCRLNIFIVVMGQPLPFMGVEISITKLIHMRLMKMKRRANLYPYREARVNKFMMFHGLLLIIALFIVANVAMPIATLA